MSDVRVLTGCIVSSVVVWAWWGSEDITVWECDVGMSECRLTASMGRLSLWLNVGLTTESDCVALAWSLGGAEKTGKSVIEVQTSLWLCPSMPGYPPFRGHTLYRMRLPCVVVWFVVYVEPCGECVCCGGHICGARSLVCIACFILKPSPALSKLAILVFIPLSVCV